MRRLLTLVSLLVFCGGCANDRRAERTVAASSPSPARPTPQATPTPSTAAAPVKQSGTGRFNTYSFKFERAGEQVTARFTPVLPSDQFAVLGASREVIDTVYGERPGGFPRLVPWSYKDEKRQGIKLEGVSDDFIFLPEKDAAGQIESLVFWKVAKGSVQ